MPHLSPSVFQTWFDTLKQLEVGAILAAAGAAAGMPVRMLKQAARRFTRGLDYVADRPILAVALPGLLSFVGAAAAGLFVHVLEPTIHDEFSYLLQADTFADGRLSNPSHPMWKHFESFHINQQPTYQSKYPPAQGFFLAIGLRATGDPIVGVWLSSALAMSAFAWMFRGWLPPRWAAWGSLVVLIRVGITSYWAQAYWGGAVAALGGALVYGAYPRLRAAPNVRDALWLGAGLFVLSNARPFEGLLATLPVAAGLAWHFVRATAAPRAVWLSRVAVPVAVILAIDAAWIATYNKAVTGNATTMPYFVHAQTYARISQWIFGSENVPQPYRHEQMRRYYEEEELPYFERQQRATQLFIEIPWKIVRAADIPYSGLMALPILFAIPLWRRRRTRFPLLAFLFALGGLSTLTVLLSHYGAPSAAAGFLIVTQGLRHLAACRFRGRRFGRVAAIGATVVAVGTSIFILHYQGTQADSWGRVRAHVQSRMEEVEGNHLVVVQYGPLHICHFEWVYNKADIDASQVVWARDMGEAENRELIAYFLARGRKIWLMRVDDDGVLPEPVEYPGLR